MLQRYSIAFAGACVVTLMLIYGMSAIAEYFNRPDSEVYLRVMDVIPGSGARRLPARRMPEAQPNRARVDLEVESLDADTTAIGLSEGFEEAVQPIEVTVDLPAAEAPR